MKTFRSLFVLAVWGAACVSAQKHEIGLTLGRIAPNDRTSQLRAEGGVALQANYGGRITDGECAALYGEVHFLANPLRHVSGAGFIARDFSSLYVTPGLRLKFNPKGRFQPYGVIGGGYALYENSTFLSNGAANLGERHTHTWAADFGGGIDIPVWRFLTVRGEVRDFITGNPGYNVSVPGSQHNIVAGGGFLLRFGE